MKFPSAKDWWLTLIVWGAMIAAIGSGIFSITQESLPTSEIVMTSLATIGIPIFVIWLWFSTYYVIDEKNLLIKYGPFRKTVPLHTITSVRKTNNPLSSPALSLKRLEILYGKYDTALISPKDRDEFIKILAEKCPQMREDKND
jgi:hypothetical protein